MDDLTLALTFVFVFGAACAVLLSWRGLAPAEAGHGEFYALLLTAVLGMVVLAASTNLVAVFLGYELLSIPLYVLCATHLRREHCRITQLALCSKVQQLIIRNAAPQEERQA